MEGEPLRESRPDSKGEGSSAREDHRVPLVESPDRRPTSASPPSRGRERAGIGIIRRNTAVADITASG